MRADRLLSMMMLLQTRGKMTAETLAQALGVSRRTILRDVDALSFAGVPVYSVGGHGGGIALDEAYRTTLTGLQQAEVQSLFIASNAAVLRDLGLSAASEGLLLKLLASLPDTQRPTVDHIRQRLLIDPSWWWNDTQSPPFWEALQQAVYDDHLIEVTYEHYNGEIVERVLEPYSLVYKGSLWYLVAQREDEMRTYRIARFHRVTLLDQSFMRRRDYDLSAYWQANTAAFIQSFSEYRFTLRVHPERAAFVKWLMPGRWQIDDDAEDNDWIRIRIVMDSPVMAKMLVFGLGDMCEVIEPTDLAAETLRDAQALVAHLSSSR
jgi:predicted DNA-binding transcriptional regulator YafY